MIWREALSNFKALPIMGFGFMIGIQIVVIFYEMFRFDACIGLTFLFRF